MKTFLLICAIIAVLFVFSTTEVTTDDWQQVSPRERCEAHFKGTPNADQCKYL